MLGPLVQELLKAFLKDAAPAEVKKRMTKAVPKIVAGMTAKGMTPETAEMRLVIRDALFRLWRSVIPSGDISDFIRDRQEGKIVPMVVAHLPAGASLTVIVKTTLDALIDQTF